MPFPYSYDLPEKVIQAIEFDGLKKTQASLVFNISRNTIDFWLKRRAETGDFQALPNQSPVNGDQITDWEKFREFALIHEDKTFFRDGKTLAKADQRCQLLETLRVACFSVGVRRATLTHDITCPEENWLDSKKKLMAIANVIKSSGKRS
ncbi:MAG: IS630 transposase-related protein [Nostoc sp.]|uniref:IS630 transposase-related protein n=1 Tax=Nostoc sp. TaxID=1180 RepID=UPI002FF9E813